MRIIHTMNEVRELCKLHKEIDMLIKKRMPIHLVQDELSRYKLELADDIARSLQSGRAWKCVIVLPEDNY